MARKSMTELLADLGISFPDNSTGLITPQIVRDYFTNFINAIRPAYALLERLAAVAQAVTVAPVPMAFTTADVTSSNGEYTANAAIGRITRLLPGTNRFTFTTDLTVPTGVERLITFTLYKNGAATPWRQSMSTTDSNFLYSVSFTAILYEGAANVNYDMYVQISTNETVTFSNALFASEIVPVNSY